MKVNPRQLEFGFAQPPPKECSLCKQPGAVKVCAFPLRRKGKKTVCGRRICNHHAHAVGNGKFYCSPHENVRSSFITHVIKGRIGNRR